MTDATEGITRVHPRKRTQAYTAYILHLKLVPWLPLITSAFALLSIFELPQWCTAAALDGHPHLCRSDLYPSFDIPTLPPLTNLLAEVAFISLLATEIILCVCIQGLPIFLQNVRQCWSAALVLLSVLEVLVVWSPLPLPPWYRVSAYLRAGLVVLHSRDVRQELAIIRLAAARFVGVTVLLVIFLLLCGWFATMIFAGSAEGGEVMLTPYLLAHLATYLVTYVFTY